jgi:hypothetical protein
LAPAGSGSVATGAGARERGPGAAGGAGSAGRAPAGEARRERRAKPDAPVRPTSGAPRGERRSVRRTAGPSAGTSVAAAPARRAADRAASPAAAATAGNDAARGLRQDLAAIEARMRVEDERHAAAMSELRAAEQEAIASGRDRDLRRARKAIDAAVSSYQARKSALGDHRLECLRRLQAAQQQERPAPERSASR